MTKPAKGQEFGLPRRVELEYEKAMGQIIGKVLPPKYPNETFEEWLGKIAELSSRKDVQEACDLLASRMVGWVGAVNERSWRAASKKAQRSDYLYSLLNKELQGPIGARVAQLTRENSRLISSLPHTAAVTLVDEITKAAQKGARPSTLAKLARVRFPQLLKSRVNLIARTETAKASAALTHARCEALGIQFYIWRTSEDVRVRASHKKMDGVVVPWDDPPSPERLVGEPSQGHYNAGEIYNCRCTQIVVLTVDDIKFPAKVYYKGAVRQVNKRDFQKLFNLERRAA